MHLRICVYTYPILVVGQSAGLFQLVFPQLLEAVVHAARQPILGALWGHRSQNELQKYQHY